MEDTIDAVAWSSLLMGLSALAAGFGALRRPGIWQTMIIEVERSPALQFVCGMCELVVGAMVYLSSPWVAKDVLSCVMKAMGGAMMIEALTIMAICDIYTQFWLKNLGAMRRGWPIFTMLLGAVLVAAAMLRFR